MTLLAHNPRRVNSTGRSSGLMVFLVLVGVVVVWYVVLGVGVYSGRWHGEKTVSVLHWAPLPSGMVGWRPLDYGAYLNQRQAVEHYTSYLRTSTSGVYQAQSADDISATTITKMIRLVGSEQALKKLKSSVTAADVNQAYTSQLLQNGDAERVKATIFQLYGWSPEEFKTNVIRPAIIRDKLQEKLSFDESFSGAAKQQAQEVLALVNEGRETFTDLAKKYSDDVYGANGGDVGFVKQGDQTKEIDDVAFTLELNEVSALVHTKYGYHIIKPTERKTVDGVEQVHVFQITILAPQVDEYLDGEIKKSSVQVFVPGLAWDAKNVQAVKK